MQIDISAIRGGRGNIMWRVSQAFEEQHQYERRIQLLQRLRNGETRIKIFEVEANDSYGELCDRGAPHPGFKARVLVELQMIMQLPTGFDLVQQVATGVYNVEFYPTRQLTQDFQGFPLDERGGDHALQRLTAQLAGCTTPEAQWEVYHRLGAAPFRRKTDGRGFGCASRFYCCANFHDDMLPIPRWEQRSVSSSTLSFSTGRSSVSPTMRRTESASTPPATPSSLVSFEGLRAQSVSWDASTLEVPRTPRTPKRYTPAFTLAPILETPAYICFGHELIHARRMQLGLYAPYDTLRSGQTDYGRVHEIVHGEDWLCAEQLGGNCSRYPNREEYEVIEAGHPLLLNSNGLPITENQLRLESQLGLRYRYTD